MRNSTRPLTVALAVAVFLASLSLVAWRQARARDVLADLERIRGETTLAQAEESELERQIEYLESRARVVPEARDRLGMHTPESKEIVILPAEAP